MKRYLFLILLIVSLALVGCTRSASQSPEEQGVAGEETGELPFPEPGEGDDDTPSGMETLVAGGFATLTAVAQEGEAGEAPQVEETEEPEEAASTEGEAAEAKEPEPTATPKPKEEKEEEKEEKKPAKVDCSSPFTVQRGDWVWDIGRRCNVHPQSIINANGLVWPYTVYAGQELTLPKDAPPFPGD